MQATTTRTTWGDEGYARPPEERTASGGEVIYRAYGGSSGVLANCFFAAAIDSTPIGHWTAELLEQELNASLWGNDFEGVTRYEMIPGARFRIGPIAHDGYVGIDGGQPFSQRSFITPSGIFKQVMFVLADGASLMSCVKRTGRFNVFAGRYARQTAARARALDQ